MPCVVRKALMVTVEVDPVRVEARLVAGEICCPACDSGVLARWGWARWRRVAPAGEPVKPAVASTGIGVRGIDSSEAGIGSALLTASSQIGSAVGLAVLATVAATATSHAIGMHPMNEALPKVIRQHSS